MAKLRRALCTLGCALTLMGCNRLSEPNGDPLKQAPSDLTEGSSSAPRPSNTSGSLSNTGEGAGMGVGQGGDASSMRVKVSEPDKASERPQVVLVQTNPHALVLGADVPNVVIYEDGTVITQRGAHRVTATAPKETRELIQRVITKELLALPTRWSVRAPTDQPRLQLMVRDTDGWKLLDVYGVRLGSPPLPSTNPPGVPTELFMAACEALASFEPPWAVPWVPQEIELMLWDFSHAKEKPLPWPAGVPQPPRAGRVAKGTQKHPIPGRHEAALSAFLEQQGPRRGVELDGKSMSLSYRRLVPGDATIQAVRRCALSAHAGSELPPGCTRAP